jgi:hypothetical protein
MRRSGANQKASAVQTMRRRIGIGLIARALIGPAAAFLLAITSPATAQTVKGDVTVINKDGYVRLIVRLAEEVESTTKVAGGIIVVQFKRPVEVGIEKVANAAPDYVGAARRDPDGAGLRIALSRKVTVNSMAAGERLFIDLLPDTWTGVAPGLPQDVIEDLARRAREAEKLLRQQRMVNQKSMRAMRVRVATQPTFTRYVFELHDVIPVTTDRTKEALIVTFGVPMKFDLTDAKANLPPVLRSIEGFVDTDASSVRFALSSVADIRTFREDTNYIVDIGAADGKESNNDTQRDGLKDAAKIETPAGNGLNVRAPLAGLDAPETVPAKVAPGKPQAAASRAQAPQQAPQQQAQPQREQPAEAPAEKPAPQRAPEPPPAKKSAIEPPGPAPVAQQQQPPQPQPQMKLAGVAAPQSEAPQPAPVKAAAEAQVLQSAPQSAPPPVAEKPAAPAKAAEAAPAEKARGNSGRGGSTARSEFGQGRLRAAGR